MEDIEKRSRQCRKVLAIVLVGCNTRLESCARLWQKPLAINCQQLGGFLGGFAFASKVKGNLLRLNFGLTAGAAPIRFRLRQFGAPFAALTNWKADPKR